MPRSRSAAAIEIDPLDRAIINRLQDGLPLTSAPFAAAAHALGITATELIARMERLLAAGILTRFGPFWDAAAMGGAFCLCALSAPDERFDEVAGIVNAFPEVAHNYARDHHLNMWFVLATETPAGIARAADDIARQTGLEVLRFPKLEEFFIGFKVAA